MEVSTFSGISMLRTDQTRQAMSTTMLKQAAEQQNQLANMLAQNVKQAPKPAAGTGSDFGFSTYA